MVGTVIYKNFETGSYKYIKLVAYDGRTYADIGKGGFFSCKVNPDTGYVEYDYVSENSAPVKNMQEILFVARKAREYLYKNHHITSVEFCLNLNECVLRPVSFKAGVYEPVDFGKLFDDSGFYMLCTKMNGKTPMWLSVLCEVMNFCVQRAFAVSDSPFGFSGYGIYVNLAVFERQFVQQLDVPEKIKKAVMDKKVTKIPFEAKNLEIINLSVKPAAHPKGRLLYYLAFLKAKSFNRFAVNLKEANCPQEWQKCVMSLPEDRDIMGFTDDFVSALTEYAEPFYDYGYVEAKSHVYMLRLFQVLELDFNKELQRTIAQIAKSASVNGKLIGKLPCAPFYDSDGTAIWD